MKASAHPTLLKEAAPNRDLLDGEARVLQRAAGCLKPEPLDGLRRRASRPFSIETRKFPRAHAGLRRKNIDPQIIAQVGLNPIVQLIEGAVAVCLETQGNTVLRP